MPKKSKNCAPCVTNCNPQSYYCTYPNNSVCFNANSEIYVSVIDFSNEVNENHKILTSEKNLLPSAYTSGSSGNYDFKTSSVGIYVNGCPGSTLDSFFINYQNIFQNQNPSTLIDYGQPNNFLGNSLPYYSWNATGLTNSGRVVVKSSNVYSLNNTFRVIVNTVNTTTNVFINNSGIVVTENYKDTIVSTYFADFYCNEIQNSYPLNTSTSISALILRLNELNPGATGYIFKTAHQKNSFYNYGTNQSSIPTGTQTAQDYLVKLINNDNDLNLQVALDAIKW